ncbi:MAG: hypothetical protein RL885_23940 [Planctomycetota bacterium]
MSSGSKIALTTIALTFLVALMAPVAQAQFQGTEPNPLAPIHLNEIYASHAGTDDQEFIEIYNNFGTPYNLDFHMVLVVEGEGGGAGTLDRAYVLSGFMPSDGYYVLGGTAVANLDQDLGATNLLENGTENFYLVDAGNQAGVDAITALVGTDLDPEDDNTTTILSLASVLDGVAIVDGDFPATDIVYDGLPTVGPDGSFFPAGVFRDGNFPAKWRQDFFLDFDDDANFRVPRTPGVSNTRFQANIGFAGPGDARMYVFGEVLSSGNSATLLVTGAAADAPMGLIISRQISLTPFKGGVLLPFPPEIFLGVATDTNGEFTASLPGGFGEKYFFQGVVIDASQPQGHAITNTVRVDFKN